MAYAVGDWQLERRYSVGIELLRRQDPESSDSESAPPDTSTQPSSSPVQSSTRPPTSSATSARPTSPTVSPTPTPPVSPTQPTAPPTDSETSPTATPTDPTQPSSEPSASGVSTRSAFSSSSRAGSAPAGTQIITSVITTNGAGQTIVTVSITSNYAVPTSAPKSSSNTGAIVGGVVGGVGGLLILIILLWFIRRRTKKDKFEENMFEPDRNVDRPVDLVEGDDVNDPEAMARPYYLPPSPTRPEMGMAANTRPLSVPSGFSHDRPLSSEHHEAVAMPRPTSGNSYYAPPGAGISMPTPMPMSLDHIAHMQSRTNSTLDQHSQPSERMSDGGSSSARALKEREARRFHVANEDRGVVVHSDGGRAPEEPDDDQPREIPPTYESIGGPSGAR